MQRPFFCFLVVLLFQYCPTTAQVPNPPLMGLSIYPPSYGIEYCLRGDAVSVYTAFFYIQNAPEAYINGFECRLWAEGDATILGWEFPVNAIDAGTNGNTVVGFAEPVPVFDGFAVLATVDILTMHSGSVAGDPAGDDKSPIFRCYEPTATLHLAPTRPTSSIPGTMAYLDADAAGDPLRSAYNALSLENDTIFFIKITPVANESRAWGSIKAIFR